MEIGMLWFDDSSRPLPAKVERAVEHFRHKYGHQPTLCLVNPAVINGGKEMVGGVEVRGARSVLPHHFLVGVDDKAARGGSREPGGEG
jgi:hypothetical protein